MNRLAVPFFRPSIGEDEIAAVSQCLRSGWLTTGPKTAEFENAFQALIGGDSIALAVNSATAALHLGLEALGVGPGDEVIVPTLTFTATAEVIRYLGATPIFVDIDLSTLCIDVNETASAITPQTKVIMPVHFGGLACDMTSLRALADLHGLRILDDAAHALPAYHAGKIVGNNGADATAFSFYANKTMTTGEGGMLVTSDPAIAARARTMRLHGIDRDVFNRFTNTKASWVYDVIAPGFKYNMTDIASALGVVQLGRSDEFIKSRSSLAQRYNQAFKDLPVILPPQAKPGDVHSWHLYLLQISEESPIDRDQLISLLRMADIGTSVHYRPLHQMSFWKAYCTGKTFPNAEKYFSRCVSMPLFMSMTHVEQDHVIEAVRQALL